MPRVRYLLYRRLGPLGLVLTAWDIWKRLPPPVRRRILHAATKRGPMIAESLRRAGDRRARH
ncbi:MAG: hypothetical protein ICV59_03255 [Thermoleophilia bacterium]|nr:hypothetical protein [Thermoleophilia bacterium]